MKESYGNNAHSLDGLEFFFESNLSSHLSTGDFVVLKNVNDDNEKKYLGVIEIAEIVSERFPRSIDNNVKVTGIPYLSPSSITRSEGIKGSGRILGRIDTEKFRISSRSDFFDHYAIADASKDDIEAWSTHITQSETFSIGTFLNSQKTMVPLDSKNLSRHTFLSGQTGSGKSSVIRTTIKSILQLVEKPKIIIFDLNSEYKDIFKKTKGGKEFKSINLSPEINENDGNELIDIDFFLMEDDWKLSIIDIDPIKNPYAFFHFRDGLHSYYNDNGIKEESSKIEDLLEHLFSSKFGGPTESAFLFDNIDISSWDIWKSEGAKFLLDEVIMGDYELINIDLGYIKSKIQKLTVASFILELLWRRREEKQDFLIVVDEAHNIIPCTPSNLISHNITERMIDIAGEGRKFGLYLFLCSQQPSKIHENVLSLCNNLILLQTTSSMDLEFIYSKFSSIPRSFINKARFLKQGEAIIGGPLVNTPLFIKIDYSR